MTILEQPIPVAWQRKHGIAAARKGCTCDICSKAKREHGRPGRLRRYAARQQRPGDEMCLLCLCWFHPKGIVRHEMNCRG